MTLLLSLMTMFRSRICALHQARKRSPRSAGVPPVQVLPPGPRLLQAGVRSFLRQLPARLRLPQTGLLLPQPWRCRRQWREYLPRLLQVQEVLCCLLQGQRRVHQPLQGQ